jgi:glutathione S-transferase
METHALVAVVTLVSLLVYVWMGLRVGRARGAYGVSAPAVTGDERFERIFRTQQNTLEWLPIYIPSLWLFAWFWSDAVAAALGLVWIVGRILYAQGYASPERSRSMGFQIQALAVAVLLFGALGRAIGVWVQTH